MSRNLIGFVRTCLGLIVILLAAGCFQKPISGECEPHCTQMERAGGLRKTPAEVLGPADYLTPLVTSDGYAYWLPPKGSENRWPWVQKHLGTGMEKELDLSSFSEATIRAASGARIVVTSRASDGTEEIRIGEFPTILEQNPLAWPSGWIPIALEANLVLAASEHGSEWGWASVGPGESRAPVVSRILWPEHGIVAQGASPQSCQLLGLAAYCLASAISGNSDYHEVAACAVDESCTLLGRGAGAARGMVASNSGLAILTNDGVVTIWDEQMNAIRMTIAHVNQGAGDEQWIAVEQANGDGSRIVRVLSLDTLAWQGRDLKLDDEWHLWDVTGDWLILAKAPTSDRWWEDGTKLTAVNVVQLDGAP